MMKSGKILAAVLLCSAVCGAQSEPPSSGGARVWSENLDRKIDLVLKLKSTAMRSKDMLQGVGPLAEFARLMDEIAELAATEGIRGKLEEKEGGDIRGKVMLWAIDRKARRSLYDRIPTDHMNYPPAEKRGEYQAEKFDDYPEGRRRALLGTVPAVLLINPVKPAKLTEEFRLPLEYHYFAPPSPPGAQFYDWRYNLGDALLKIGSPKTIVVWKEDAKSILPELGKAGADDRSDGEPEDFLMGNAGWSVYWLCAGSSNGAFEAVFDLWRLPIFRETIRGYLKELVTFESFDRELRKTRLERWAAWAKTLPQTAPEKELADYIGSLELPPLPPPRDSN